MHSTTRSMRCFRHATALAAALAALVISFTGARAADTPAPATVTVAGSLQSEAGCSGALAEMTRRTDSGQAGGRDILIRACK